MDGQGQELIQNRITADEDIKENKMEDYMVTEPYAHQTEALELSKDRRAYGLLLEQGLGKTKVILDNAAYLFYEDKIAGLLVFAPNGVHTNWIRRECPVHLTDGADPMLFAYDTVKRKNKSYQKLWKEFLRHEGLCVFAINIEALSTSINALKDAEKFLRSRKCMLVVDESSRIKTPKSKRTKNIIKLGRLAPYRRILTGTPVTQSPFDLFTQFKFLDADYLGFGSYYAFKHHYGIWETEVLVQNGQTRQFEKLVKHMRLDDLARRIKPHSFRRTKAECLDLPPKIYKTISLPMSPAQSKLYNRMDEHGILEFDNLEILAPHQITKLLRLQQITGGFIPSEEIDPTTQISGQAIPGPNPKLNFLIDAVTDDYHGKTIIWAKFRFEIDLIVQTLGEKFGHQSIVQIHGGVTGDARDNSVDRFQTDDTCRFLVGQQASGIGITLHAAETVFYYSNPFSYEQRYQSEDRAHRIGLKHPVVYIDLVVSYGNEVSVDEKVRGILHKSRKIADKITGDSERRS